jgi:transcriptional regulator with GAF, ATPase, and Fis domain
MFPIVASVTALVAGANHGPIRVYWSIGAVVATAGTAILNALKERQSRVSANASVTATTELARTINRAGEPLVTALGNVTAAKTASDRQAAFDALLHLVVEVAASRCGKDARVRCNVRSVYYGLTEDRLVRKWYAGRQGNKPPRREFQRSRTDHDDEVLKLARSDGVRFVEDLEKDPPPHFIDPRGQSYKSFVAIPVKADEESFGLLCIDSDKPYSLTDVDRGYGLLLAGLLAAALAHQPELGTMNSQPSIPQQHGAELGSHAEANGPEGLEA